MVAPYVVYAIKDYPKMYIGIKIKTVIIIYF